MGGLRNHKGIYTHQGSMDQVWFLGQSTDPLLADLKADLLTKIAIWNHTNRWPGVDGRVTTAVSTSPQVGTHPYPTILPGLPDGWVIDP